MAFFEVQGRAFAANGGFSLLGRGNVFTGAPGCAIVYTDAADPLIIPSGFLYLVFDVIEC